MVLAGQGQSEAALELLQDAAARNPSLASSCGVMKAMEEVERSRGSR
jgi:hypothetical protein